MPTLKTTDFAEDGRLDPNDEHAPKTISPNLGVLTTKKLFGGRKKKRGSRKK